MFFLLIRHAVGVVLKAWPLPNFNDAKAVQDWLERLTPELTTLIVAVAGQLRAGDFAEPLGVLERRDIEEAVRAYVAEEAIKVDTGAIVTIMLAIAELVKLWQDDQKIINQCGNEGFK